MADLVLGVKLKYELGASLPKPVSFPFESIGDYRPVTRIPKYDFSLEKQIMKEIAKQKQADQYNSLKQAQQQLAMVDLIASRKNRHKGKEPDRSSPSVAASAVVSTASAGPSIAGGTLIKPSSDSGVSRLQQSTGGSVSVQGSNHAGISDTATAQHAATNALASTIDVSSTVQPERSHSAGPTTSASEPPAEKLLTTTNAPVPDGAASTSAANASYISSTYPSAAFGLPTQPIQRPTYMQYVQSTGSQYQQQQQQQQQQIRPQMQGQYHTLSTQPHQQQYPGNTSSGFVSIPQTVIQQQPQYSQQTQPMAMSTSAPVFGPRPLATAGPATASTAFSSAQQPIHQSYAQSQSTFSTPPASWLSPAPQKETSAPVQPALPPKPDEWRVHSPSPGSAAGTSSSSHPASVPPLPHGKPAPALPPRNQPQQQDGSVPPAIPPKPYMAFSEFDYASDDHSALGSSSQTGHVEQLNTLLSMGFSRPQAIHALEMYDYDVNKASNYLIDKAFH